MKPIALIFALALAGCILDHEREKRPGKVFIIDNCQRVEDLGWPHDPKPGTDTNFTCITEGMP